MVETVETICKVILTLCVCVMTFSLLYESVIKEERKRKAFRDPIEYHEVSKKKSS